jgi:hypothetical protein
VFAGLPQEEVAEEEEFRRQEEVAADFQSPDRRLFRSIRDEATHRISSAAQE